MKRALTQKVNPIPACEVDNSAMVGHLKPIPPEVNRRARTSAAMIGLAISMGASSLLIPQQGDSAMATEPGAGNSALSTLPSVQGEAGAVTALEAKSAPETAEAAQQLPLLQSHKAQEWQPTGVETSAARESEPIQKVTFNQSENTNRVEPDNTATNDRPGSTATAKSTSHDGISNDIKVGDIVTSQSESYNVGQNQSRQSAAPEASGAMAGESATAAADDVNNLLRAKQAVALNRLRESSNRLRASLAEWKSEELENTSAQVSEPAAPAVVAEHLKPVVEQAPASVEVPNWQPKLAAVEPAVTKASPVDTAAEPAPEVWEASVVSQPAVSAPTMVYQVKPGDTIGTIARNYGMSVSALAKANDLDNPNHIQVAQLISIPQSQSSAVTAPVPAANPFESEPVSPNFAARNRSSASSKAKVPIVTALTPVTAVDNISAPTVPPANWTPSAPVASASASSGTDAVPPGYKGLKYEVPEHISRTKQTSEVPVGKNFQLNTPSGEPSLFAENEPNQGLQASSNQQNNPYVERLRAEILQLREQYKHQQGSDTLQRMTSMRRPYPTPNPTPAFAPSSPTPEPRPSSTYSPSPVKPELSRNQNNEPLQTQIQRPARQPSQQAPIQIPVPEAGAVPAKRQQQLVATAPLGPEVYQPYNQPAPRMVAPELPPLQGPDNYLPDGVNPNFNGYNWPTRGVLTSGFGRRWGRMHKGIDIAAPTGTPIVASAPGVVVYARWNSGGYGNLVDIRHSDGSLTRYGHNSRIFVQEGQVVEQGQQIAAMGSTGYSTGPHCHFEIHPPGQGAVNPMAFLPRR
ncbi:peptidoglycan DD-metalloendopeptidase family protein [Aerosakkonema funiforme]|uniref:Peptidoglycan DD-metalloendopeptidase family protein n=1 Tax=Aerosakkonema funiforme FACHB-1375 TaxID=2949571 RepID=A0A926VMD5_9CYAN|nr:peptidoglycan DD-metalloendopeptidase family protein [Aerosakkonema funiforme]MBD2185487.1 peptidoglycan DD-metalloendopeptidase family protein [Aerosakkonema funiforme FACHB-1375]